MSQRLISLSPTLKQLRDEGYGVDVKAGCLVVHKLPYFNAATTVCYGTLVVKLNLASDDKLSGTVDDHVAHFAGDIPCDTQGAPMTFLVADSNEHELGGVKLQHRLSRKPLSGTYQDYRELVHTYTHLICAPVESLDSNVKARSFPAIESTEEESVFNYTDTASSRAEIDAVTRKLMTGKVAIVGVGGTGSYVLDLISKTPVAEIHIFDGDIFSQHNAFRAPGAPSKEELQAEPLKVDYLHERYSKMHRHIVRHNYQVTDANVSELDEMSFIFICVDRAPARKAIVAHIEQLGIPFIDVGMGIYVVKDKLTGMVRTTTSTSDTRDTARIHLPLEGGDENDEYSTNIQIADLNAVNAALAVIKWKKLCGFYADLTSEIDSMFKVTSNVIINTEPV